MSDVPITTWPNVAAVLLLLVLAALGSLCCRAPSVSSLPLIPRFDLSLWVDGRSRSPRGWPVPTRSRAAFLDNSWSGYYEKQFAGIGRRVCR
jgi:hypothetical protein